MTLATSLFLGIAVVLAVLASTLSVDGWAENGLWLASLAAGTLGLFCAYAIGITWTRRRKRLWG